MKVIDKGNYKTFMEKGVLKVGDYTRLELEEINNLSIIANNNNEIIVGNDCNITCKDNNAIKMKNRNLITSGSGCIINGIDNNEIVSELISSITVEESNTIIVGRYSIINGGYFNVIKVEEKSNIRIKDDSTITINGTNIILEITNEEASTTINNFSTNSVILTYDKMGEMKIYKTNELKQDTIIVSNGIIFDSFGINK